jgi:hypothetical protein
MVQEARELSPAHSMVWHAWAVINYDQLQQAEDRDGGADNDATPSRRGSEWTRHQQEQQAQQAQQTQAPTGASPQKKRYFKINMKGNARSASIANLNRGGPLETDLILQYVSEAIKGFIKSICLGGAQSTAFILQDTLRVITLWFSYGIKKSISAILDRELDSVRFISIYLSIYLSIYSYIYLYLSSLSLYATSRACHTKCAAII